jgi:hypothetical protein
MADGTTVTILQAFGFVRLTAWKQSCNTQLWIGLAPDVEAGPQEPVRKLD